MPVLPKRFLLLGASLRTARAARRLRRTAAAVPEQEQTFGGLTTQLAATAFGRENGLEPGMSYATFRSRVPLRGYAQFVPYIGRMQRGEADVLWPGQCALYANTSGTVAGSPKCLPVTDRMLAHFRQAGLEALLCYTARVGHAGVFRGRHLLLGGATTLTRLADSGPFPAYCGDLSCITALNQPAWAERHLYEPGAAIEQMPDWSAKVAAIVKRTRQLDISLLAGMPNWLLILADALLDSMAQGQSRPTDLQCLWPNLECLMHSGVPLGPYQGELRQRIGKKVNFHEIYPATEGFIAAQDSEAGAGLRLMTDVGLFFEFLPMNVFEESLPAHLSAKAVPLAGIETGVDYALVLTTPAGLCRYVLGDVVRFVSTAPPRLVCIGRTELPLNAFGEQVVERELTDTLTAVCQEHRWELISFHVAPHFISSLTGQLRGRHEWWIELKPGSIETPTGNLLTILVDTELASRNRTYAEKRAASVLEPPMVRLVMPGVFEHWMRFHQRWGGQSKMPRCRSDRQIADEMTRIARFTES